MAPWPRDSALLRTTPGSVSTQGHMGVISSLLLHSRSLQHTATHCNTLQHTATHCNTLQHTATHCNTQQHTATHNNTLQYTACQHKVTWGSFLIGSLVRTWNTFSGASLFIRVTCFVRSEEKHPRTYVCDMQTYTFPFICVTWIEWHEKRSFIHICLIHSYMWHRTHSFTCVTCFIHSEKKHSRLICVTSRQAFTPSYVWLELCDMGSSHLFICVTGHSLIHEWVEKKTCQNV